MNEAREREATVYLACAAGDQVVGKLLAAALAERGVRALGDLAGDAAGTTIEAAVREQIRAGRVVVFVCSGAALRSEWWRAELQLASSLEAPEILPIVVDDEAAQGLPEALSGLTWLDLRPEPGAGVPPPDRFAEVVEEIVRRLGLRPGVDVSEDRSAAPEGARRRGRLGPEPIPTWLARLAGVVGIAGAITIPWIAVWASRAAEEATAAPAEPPVTLRPELVVLPGGTFMMGSRDGEGSDDERPRHAVTVSPFAIARTEVTVAHYEAVMGDRPSDCSVGCADDMPVQSVNWEDALRYANRLTDRENTLRPERPALTRCYDESTWAWDRGCTGYRLPTEAEWEYAARAGTETAYSFGEDAAAMCAYGNIADRSRGRKDAECDDGYADLAPVGRFLPNGWGLHDMHGNVWEWVYDGYDAGFYGEDGSKVTDPVSMMTGASGVRALRGGSFLNWPGNARSAYRLGLPPTYRNRDGGLRVVRGRAPSIAD